MVDLPDTIHLVRRRGDGDQWELVRPVVLDYYRAHPAHWEIEERVRPAEVPVTKVDAAGPTDLLCVLSEKRLSAEACERIREDLDRAWPGRRIAIFDKDLSLGSISADLLDALRLLAVGLIEDSGLPEINVDDLFDRKLLANSSDPSGEQTTYLTNAGYELVAKAFSQVNQPAAEGAATQRSAPNDHSP